MTARAGRARGRFGRLLSAVCHPRRTLALTGRLRRGVLVLSGGQALAQLIVALSTPLLTRLYDPSAYGAYAAAIALLTLVLSVTCLTYERAVPVPEDDEMAADLVLACLMATLAMMTITALALFLVGERLLNVFGIEALAPYVWWLVVAQGGGGILLAATGWTVRTRDYAAMAKARVGQSLLMVSAQMATGLAGLAAGGLLAGDALGRVAAGAHLMRRARATGSLRARPPRLLLRTARRYRRFPLIGSWPAIMNALGLQAPLLLLIAIYGPRTGGLFAFAQRLVGAPLALLTVSIGEVFVAEAAHRAREGALRGLFRRTLGRLAAVGVPLLLVAVPGSFLVGPLFGPEWSEAGRYVAILVPLYIAQLLSSPFGGVLSVLERQDLYFLRETLRVGLLSLAVAAAGLLALPAIGAVAALSAAGAVAYFAYGVISWHAVANHDRTRPTPSVA